MVERITVRILDPWAEYKRTHCGCKDASSYNRCEGLPNCELYAGHPERKTPPPTVEYRRTPRRGVPVVVYVVLTVQALCGIALALNNLGVFR